MKEEPPTPRSFPGEFAGSIVAGALLLAGMVAAWLGAGAPTVGVIAEGVVWVSLAIGMVYGGRAAWEALAARRFDIDVLMVLAAGLAAVMGHPEDGALLLFLFVLAGALEDRAMRRTMRAVEALHRLMPTQAIVLREGSWAPADPQGLRPGERVRVRTGELVPADARVVQGASALDQSTLTGESLPREVGEGDEVYAGTLNVANPFEAEVTRPVAESSLRKVLDLVISAQQQREPLQRAIDRLSQPYAIGVVVVCTVVFLVWWLLLRFPAADAAFIAIALLIVGSPCALVIATPTATLAGISRAARAGLLFKGGQAIERLARMGAVCMDKTGTLTRGRPRVRQVYPVGWSRGPRMLSLAAALESGSTHPIAQAVVEAARARGVEPAGVSGLTDIPGRGISARVGGAEARLGTLEHCEPLIPVCLRSLTREVLEKVRARGQLGVVVALGDERAGGTPAPLRAPEAEHRLGEPTYPEGPEAGEAAVLVLSDEIRPGARELVDRLHALGVWPVRMLTGDNRTTAAQVAAELGIDQWDAELLPEDKVRILEQMRAERRGGGQRGAAIGALTEGGQRRLATGVGVIGDGVNDAPALAAADVSVAIGSIGSDAALESADIVLLNDDLEVIPWAVRLARRTRAVVLFNMALALTIIGAMATVILYGSLVGTTVPLWVAVLAHEGGTLLVVLNSLRLLVARRDPASADPVQPEPALAVHGAPAEMALR